jgi:hypothetical protein
VLAFQPCKRPTIKDICNILEVNSTKVRKCKQFWDV